MLMTDDARLNRAIRNPPRGFHDPRASPPPPPPAAEEGSDSDSRAESQVKKCSRRIEHDNKGEERHEDEKQGQGEKERRILTEEQKQQLEDEEEETKELSCSSEDYEKYLKYKTKIYLVKVYGEKLNIIATDSPTFEEKIQAYENLITEIAVPFSFQRHQIIRQTNSAEIKLIRCYQDDSLRNIYRPDRGWCLDLEIKICEGKHHQVRRMIKRMDLKVMSLCRIAIASILRIESIPNPGDCRWLENDEVDELYTALLIPRRCVGGEGGDGGGEEENRNGREIGGKMKTPGVNQPTEKCSSL
jgi:hypothetical protein